MSDDQEENLAPQRRHYYRDVIVVQGAMEGWSVAARQSGVGRDCRVDWRPAAASLAFERGPPAVAFDVHLEDSGVMNEAIDDSDRHCLVRGDLAPFAGRLVGRGEEGSPLVAGADELKEHAGFGLVFGDVGEVIEDPQMVFVEFGNGGFEREARGRQFAVSYALYLFQSQRRERVHEAGSALRAETRSALTWACLIASKAAG